MCITLDELRQQSLRRRDAMFDELQKNNKLINEKVSQLSKAINEELERRGKKYKVKLHLMYNCSFHKTVYLGFTGISTSLAKTILDSLGIDYKRLITYDEVCGMNAFVYKY